jgi:hypothetical protein
VSDIPNPLYLIGLTTGGLLVYIYFCYCLYRIAKKLKYADAWLSFVPFFNVFVFLDLSSMGALGCLLLLIPFVNIILLFFAWTNLAVRLGKTQWSVLFLLIPGAGPLILMTYLAFL